MIVIKRPALIIAIGMVAGIMYGLYFKISIAITSIFLIILIIKFLNNRKQIYFFFMKKRKIIQILLISAIISNLYFNLINLRYEKSYTKIPEKIKENATIISEAKETEYYYGYNVKIKGKKFIMYVKKKDYPKFQYGEYIQVCGEYSKPEEARNYKGFNYKEYLKTKGIYGSIKVENIQSLKKNNVNIFLKVSNCIRNKIIKTAHQILPNQEGSLLTGILIGEKSDIPEEITESFSKASISHILAISGTHISYIILGITYILNKSKTSKRLSYIITIITLVLFMFVTRFTPSVVRASIMGIIMLFAKVIYRKSDTLNSIAISLILILIFNPFAINDIGLELSYLGTIGIVLLNKKVKSIFSKYINEKVSIAISITISAQIMVLPITILKFNTITPYFMLANITAVPLAGVIILMGYINIFIAILYKPAGTILGKLLKLIVEILINIAKFTSKLPFSSISIITPGVIFIIGYYIAVFCFFENKKMKTFCIIFAIIIIINIAVGIIPIPLTIHLVDVGQRRLYFN